MRRRRKTKILATLGPASSTPEMIRALFEAGADVFRINMSHNAHNELADKVRIVRELEESVGRPIAILADLQGPKIRLGTLPSGVRDLKKGDLVACRGGGIITVVPQKEMHTSAFGFMSSDVSSLNAEASAVMRAR